MQRFAIGIYIGSATIDAVILQGRNLVAKAKYVVSPEADCDNELNKVRTVIENVIDNFVTSASPASDLATTPGKLPTRADVISATGRVTFSVTGLMDALIERKRLQRVGVIRLCGSATRVLPPFVDHPEGLQQKINGGYGLVHGGLECTKKEISNVDDEEIARKVKELWNELGVRNFVVCGVFSPLDQSQECQAADVIRNIYTDASITESHLVS